MQKFFSTENKKMTFILITMFLNFLGFSIIIPILPFLVGRYVSGANAIALNVGLLLSAYAACQFLAAPGLGVLSDRFGRRPILLVSLIGSAIGYIFLGIGGALWILFLGRIIDGLTGGNISTIYAYIADITEPKDRGKYYGILGAASGFGFLIGPAVGGFLAHLSLTLPLFLAAGITMVNVLWGYFVLPESLKHHHKLDRVELSHLNPLLQFGHVFSIKILRQLFIAGFLYFIALFGLYGNASVFAKDVFSWGPEQIGLLLFSVGIVDVFSQGYLVRKLLPFLGEAKLAVIGLILSAVGFALSSLTALFPSIILIYTAVIILNIGDGLFEPANTGLIANSVGAKMQGRVQGASQGMQSLARIFGPFFAAWLYQYWRGLPYASEAMVTILAIILLLFSFKTIYAHKPQN